MIMIVSSAPSTIVSSTSASDSRMRRESSRMIVELDVVGQLLRSSSTAARTASATSTVLEPEIFSTSSDTARRVVRSPAAVRRRRAPSTTWPRRRADGRAVAHGDGDVGERPRVDDAARDAHEPLARALDHAAGRHFLVLARERRRQLRGRDAVGAHRVGIQLHADLPRGAADDVHAADARSSPRCASARRLGEVGDLADRPLRALQRDRHDRRVVRIEVLDDRLLDVLRQRAADARHLRLHVLLRGGDVDAEVELRRTIEMPSSEVELISLIPCTVLSASSIGSTRRASSLSARRPDTTSAR